MSVLTYDPLEDKRIDEVINTPVFSFLYNITTFYIAVWLYVQIIIDTLGYRFCFYHILT